MAMTMTPEELAVHMDDPLWRLNNLYKIVVKGDGDEGDDLVVQFKPNKAQRRLLARLHYRNIILKARQLGFSTLVCILWLDTALFSKGPIRCGIIAQDREAAESLFRGKVKFAYDNLPEPLRERMPLSKSTATELEFAHNGSSIRVATSMRSGTIHRLHVSEFGKICAKYPDKAREVVTGSIPAVPPSGILVIESTAEGQEGAFYDMTERAKALAQKRTPLTPKDYRFHFYAWWEADEYELNPAGVTFTDADLIYFLEVESKIGRTLPDAKRAWWVATRDSDFGGDASLMWQEYPSTSEEAFQVSTDGCYFATQLALARKQGRAGCCGLSRWRPRRSIPSGTWGAAIRPRSGFTSGWGWRTASSGTTRPVGRMFLTSWPTCKRAVTCLARITCRTMPSTGAWGCRPTPIRPSRRCWRRCCRGSAFRPCRASPV